MVKMLRFVLFSVAMLLAASHAFAMPPTLELLRDEKVNTERTFGFAVQGQHASLKLYALARFTASNGNESMAVDGFLEIDHKRVYTWKHRDGFGGESTEFYASPGDHTLTIGFTAPMEVNVGLLRIDAGGSTVDGLKATPDPAPLDRLRHLIDQLTATQKEELRQWLEQQMPETK